MRERLARARGLLGGGSHTQPGRHAAPRPATPGTIPGVPAHVAAKIRPMLERGTTASEVADEIGTSKTTAYGYLKAARAHGTAVTTGGGQSSRWQLAGGADPQPYGTIAALAEAVASGDDGCDEEAREMLLQAREMTQRRHLRLVPDTEREVTGSDI